MKIKGEVEVFKIMQDGTSTSVLKESNMVVDGASEVIVDMLTAPYSLKLVEGSATLNPSNFTVQAVTLGKAEKLYGGSRDMSGADTDQIGMHAVYNNKFFSATYIPTTGEEFGDEWIGGLGPGADTSAFKPSFQLPKEPFPRDEKLENSSKTQVAFYYENSAIALSSYADAGISAFNPTSGTLLTDPGHNLNAFYSRSENKNLGSMHQGCYAPSDGMDVRVFFGASAVRAQIEANGQLGPGYLRDSTVASAADVSGRYNFVGSMDKEGYLIAYPLQDHPTSGSDTTKGVAVSAGTTNSLTNVSYREDGLIDGSTAFIASPAVVYNFTISSSDLVALAAYKGVTNIGLWAFDQKETYKNESPPVTWVTPANNRKYKLFAKKVFSEDLTYIKDNGVAPGGSGIRQYLDLNIQWRLNFAFGETF